MVLGHAFEKNVIVITYSVLNKEHTLRVKINKIIICLRKLSNLLT